MNCQGAPVVLNCGRGIFYGRKAGYPIIVREIYQPAGKWNAYANNVDVYYYLQYLLDMAPSARMRDDELEKLAPWQPDVKAEIQRRYEAHQKAIFDAM